MRAPARRILAWAAVAWASAFTLPSVYWALGGGLGRSTIARSAETTEIGAGFAMVLWLTAVLKVALGCVAFLLRTPPVPGRMHRLLLATAFLSGLGMTLYATALLLQHGLMLAGLVSTPHALGTFALRWHLFFWDPWWLAGGTLFLLVASFGRQCDSGLVQVDTRSDKVAATSNREQRREHPRRPGPS